MYVLMGLVPLLGFLLSFDAVLFWARVDGVEAVRLLRLQKSGRYLFSDITKPE